MASKHAAAAGVDREIERYLSELDRALHGLPVSRRSEIVLDTQVLLKRLADESAGPSDFKGRAQVELGSPLTCANRHRRAAGLPPVSERPDFRWLRVALAGFVSLFLVLAVSLFFLVRSFLPVFEQDPKSGAIRILGGWVEIDTAGGGVSIGRSRYKIEPDQMKMNVSMSDGETLRGASDLRGVKAIEITALNATIILRTAPGSRAALAYECRMKDGSRPPSGKDLVSRTGDNHLRLNLAVGDKDVRCELTVPAGPAISLDLRNGGATLQHTEQNVTVKVGNGNIVFAPKDIDRYEIKARVNNGAIRLPDQRPKARDLKADLEAGNGTITGS